MYATFRPHSFVRVHVPVHPFISLLREAHRQFTIEQPKIEKVEESQGSWKGTLLKTTAVGALAVGTFCAGYAVSEYSDEINAFALEAHEYVSNLDPRSIFKSLSLPKLPFPFPF